MTGNFCSGTIILHDGSRELAEENYLQSVQDMVRGPDSVFEFGKGRVVTEGYSTQDAVFILTAC